MNRGQHHSGRTVFRESAKVVFSVTGPAELVAVDNGDLSSSEPYNNNRMHLYHGCVSTVIRLTGEQGRVVLSAASEGMYPARLVINVN
ncbi:hypothetical protein ASG89_28275 [Paenibacillus sp. Soil766]|nr:hypothetical protein ASG89_28275 [Paenibacillus sp. Soil766]